MIFSTKPSSLSKCSRKSRYGRKIAERKGSVSSLKIFVLLAISTALNLKGSPNLVNSATAFQHHNLNRDFHAHRGRNARIIQCDGSRNDSDDSTGTKEDMNLVTKSSWYAVEWFGNAFGNKESSKTAEPQLSSSPKSLDETIKRINEDNDRYYFLSGEVDSLIYDVDCVFADPFVSFSGRDRFVENLQNLGSFITKYDARVLKNSPVTYEGSTPIIETKIMVKLQLNLPWKPVLAWPWGVKYAIDPNTYLITKHIESWNIEPLEGVKMIFRPAKVNL